MRFPVKKTSSVHYTAISGPCLINIHNTKVVMRHNNTQCADSSTNISQVEISVKHKMAKKVDVSKRIFNNLRLKIKNYSFVVQYFCQSKQIRAHIMRH